MRTVIPQSKNSEVQSERLQLPRVGIYEVMPIIPVSSTNPLVLYKPYKRDGEYVQVLPSREGYLANLHERIKKGGNILCFEREDSFAELIDVFGLLKNSNAMGLYFAEVCRNGIPKDFDDVLNWMVVFGRRFEIAGTGAVKGERRIVGDLGFLIDKLQKRGFKCTPLKSCCSI